MISKVKSQYIYILNATECVDNYQKIKFEFSQLDFTSDRINFNHQGLYHLCKYLQLMKRLDTHFLKEDGYLIVQE